MIYAPAESDDIAHAVHDRHDYAVCKCVGGTIHVGYKPAFEQIGKMIPLSAHISHHRLIVERQPQSVAFARVFVYAAIEKIFPCLLALDFVYKVVAIIPCNVAHKLFQNIAMFFLLAVFGIEFDFGQLHANLVGKKFHRIVKADVFHLHDKLHHVAARSATETMIPAVVDAHRRRFFIVERTATEISPAFFLQGDVLRDDLDDVAFVFEFFHKLGSETACHKAFLFSLTIIIYEK